MYVGTCTTHNKFVMFLIMVYKLQNLARCKIRVLPHVCTYGAYIHRYLTPMRLEKIAQKSKSC